MLTTFGKRLRWLRIERGIDQKELTKALAFRGVDIGQSYISTLERSENRMPTGQVIAGLALELQTTSDYLLLLSDNPFPCQSKEGTN